MPQIEIYKRVEDIRRNICTSLNKEIYWPEYLINLLGPETTGFNHSVHKPVENEINKIELL